MSTHYDFSNAKKNPYAKRFKRSVTIRLNDSTDVYFKALADETQLPLPEPDQSLRARLRRLRAQAGAHSASGARGRRITQLAADRCTG